MRKSIFRIVILMVVLFSLLISSAQAGTIEYTNKTWKVNGEENNRVTVQTYRIFNPVFNRNVTNFNVKITILLYKVKPGDSIETIALRHGCTTNDLMRINKLDNSRLTLGQALIIIQTPSKVVINPPDKTTEPDAELELTPDSKNDITSTPKTEPEPELTPAPTKPDPAPAPEVPSDPSLSRLTADEQHMFNLVNQERVRHGLKPLKVDMDVVRVARLKSQDMVDLNYFSHQSPTYGSPFDMMRNAGISYVRAGENLAGSATVERAHTSLMNSPGHRANILNPHYTHVGIGVVDGSRYGKIFTQMFIQK